MFSICKKNTLIYQRKWEKTWAWQMWTKELSVLHVKVNTACTYIISLFKGCFQQTQIHCSLKGQFPCIFITVKVTWNAECNSRKCSIEEKPTLYLLSFWFSSSIRSWYLAISDWMELRNVELWSVSIGSSWETEGGGRRLSFGEN